MAWLTQGVERNGTELGSKARNGGGTKVARDGIAEAPRLGLLPDNQVSGSMCILLNHGRVEEPLNRNAQNIYRGHSSCLAHAHTCTKLVEVPSASGNRQG